MTQDDVAPLTRQAALHASPLERRQYCRYTRHGFKAVVLGSETEVHDISISGICLEGRWGTPGQILEFRLVARTEGAEHVFAILGEVMGHTGHWTRIRFAAMTYDLAGFIVRHIAQWNGIAPHIFK